MDHRRTVGRRAYVPPVWLIVVAAVALVAGVGALAWLTYDGTRDTDVVATESAAPEPSEAPTTAPTPEPDPSPEPTPELPSPEPTPEADRSSGVSILNGTSIQGLAATTGSFLEDLGWDDIRTGDTGGTYPANTVYYPPQFQEQAATLAADLGIERVTAAVDGLRQDRLTVVLISRPSPLP